MNNKFYNNNINNNMDKEIFLFVCFVIILICIGYSSLIKSTIKEGLEPRDKPTNSASGIAGNASTYAAQIKTRSTQLSDQLLTSKYRTDYESVIMNVDELIDNLMLATVLSLDQSKPEEGLEKLAKLQTAKVSMNSVMKFVDGS
jgi:hypothetical protein